MIPFAALGEWWWVPVLLAGVFGAVLGSFLNVLIYRLHTGRSLGGRSQCLSCGVQLRAYHLVPVLSYLALRGRCGACGSRFTPRYALVEAATAVLSALAMLRAVDLVDGLLLMAIVAVLVVIVVYDLRHLIIPDELVIVLTGLALARLGYLTILSESTLWSFGLTLLGAVGASAFFALVWYGTSGRGLGFGDVKLAAPLALLVGSAGVFSTVVLSFWIGAVVSVGLLLAGKLARSTQGKTALPFRLPTLTMKSAVPFAPFLVAGALVVLYTHVDILALFVW